VRNVGRHFTKRNHDKVANETNKTVPKEEAEGTTSGGVGFEWARGRSAGWREAYRTRAVPDPMMRPVPTAPPREIMEIWGEGEQVYAELKGWTDLSGIETSVEGLVALWVDVCLIGDAVG